MTQHYRLAFLILAITLAGSAAATGSVVFAVLNAILAGVWGFFIGQDY